MVRLCFCNPLVIHTRVNYIGDGCVIHRLPRVRLYNRLKLKAFLCQIDLSKYRRATPRMKQALFKTLLIGNSNLLQRLLKTSTTTIRIYRNPRKAFFIVDNRRLSKQLLQCQRLRKCCHRAWNFSRGGYREGLLLARVS